MTTSPAPPGIGDALAGLGRSTWALLPTVLAFLAVLVAGWLLARLARGVVRRGLARIHFDRAVRRTAVQRLLPRPPEQPSALCATLAHHLALLVTLHVAFGLWGPNPVSALIDAVVAWLPRAVVAIVVVVVAATVAHAVRDLVRAALGPLRSGRVLGSVSHAVVLGLGVVTALHEVGIAGSVTTPVLVAILGTVAGILVVGVGGGLVLPLRRRCARWLDRLVAEAHRAATTVPAGPLPAAAGGSTAAGPSAVRADEAPMVPGDEAADDEPTVVLPVAGGPVADEAGSAPAEPARGEPVATEPMVTKPVAGERVPEEVAAGPVVAGPARGEPALYRSGNAAAVDPWAGSADDTQWLDLEDSRRR